MIQSEDYRVIVADFYYSNNLFFPYILLGISSFFQAVIILYVIQLLLLHQWLSKNDLTTYEYIVYLREKEKHPEKDVTLDDYRASHKSSIIRRTDERREEEKAPPTQVKEGSLDMNNDQVETARGNKSLGNVPEQSQGIISQKPESKSIVVFTEAIKKDGMLNKL